MICHIPTDIIIEILARLPVKSLLRFSIVCKLWYSIITNPNFITTHLTLSHKRNTSELFLMFENYCNGKHTNFTLSKLDENRTELAFPFKSLNRNFHIVGSCNGLICLDNSTSQEVIIWNPCLHKSVTLMSPPYKFRTDTRYYATVFGFVSGKNTYKVVRMMCNVPGLKHDRVPPEVEVYEQGGGGEWRAIGCAPPHYNTLIFIMESQVFLHGAVHWRAFDEPITPDDEQSFSCNLIIVFEMAAEVFREIAMPPDVANLPSATLSITSLKGSLAVLYSCQYSNEDCMVWVMKDYGVFKSWTNLYNFRIPGMSYRTLGFIKDTANLLIPSTDGILVCNLEDYSILEHVKLETPYKYQPFSLEFTESLVLLEGENKYVTQERP